MDVEWSNMHVGEAFRALGAGIEDGTEPQAVVVQFGLEGIFISTVALAR